MKKILHLVSGMGLGGIHTVFLAYQKLLQNLGYEVLPILRPGALLKQYLQDTPLLEVAYSRTSLPILKTVMSNKIKAVIDKVYPDLIWVHTPIDAMLCRMSCAASRIVLTVHGFHSRYLENANILVAVSPAVFDHLKAQGLENVYLLNNFIDFEVTDHDIKWHNPIKFGALGFYRWEKGFTDFIKALALLEQKTTAFTAELCGKGRFERPIKLMTRYYGLTRLQINPWQKDVDAWMRNMDVIVVPSKQESFGMVVIEAMARGALVIATRSGGPDTLIIDGKTGILTDPNDPQGLCDAMMRVLQDPYRWTQVREKGRQFVAQHYTNQAAHRDIQDILRAC